MVLGLLHSELAPGVGVGVACVAAVGVDAFEVVGGAVGVVA